MSETGREEVKETIKEAVGATGAGETSVLQPTLSKEEQAKIEKRNKIKYAIERLSEMKRLFNYLEQAHGKTRFERKQFRRDLISTDKFAEMIIDNVIKFYEIGGHSETVWEGNGKSA